MATCEDLPSLLDKVLAKKPNTSDSADAWRSYMMAWLACRDHPEWNIDPDDVNTSVTTELAQNIIDSTKVDIEGIDVELTTGELVALMAKPSRASDSSDPPQKLVQKGADPVMLFNGQFVHEANDVYINGAGIDFVFSRTYKNQITFNGPLGFNWTHNLHIWLRVGPQFIFRSTGDLREEAFSKHPSFGETITGEFDYWIPPDGKDNIIILEGGEYVLRTPSGERYHFEADAVHSFLHRLRKITDRHGNYIDLHYDLDSLLQEVEVNHPTRLVTFDHDAEGRICLIRDYTGREWRYTYDSFGDLIAVTDPATKRYKDGLTICYDYSSASYSGELQHNLTRIIDAAGQLYLENEYGSSAGLLEFNRVVRQRQGGGTFQFEYEDFNEPLDFDYPDEQRPAHQTILVERNGQPIRHFYNKFGNLLLREQVILEHGLPRSLVEHYRYNRDGNIVGALSPEGVLTQHLFGRDYFVHKYGLTPNGGVPTDRLTWRERQAFSRILSSIRRDGALQFHDLGLTQGYWGNFPDVINPILPAGMGERKNNIIIKYTYEDEYGQLRFVSDPRYTDNADPEALSEHARHVKMLTEYIYETGPDGDANRYLVEIVRPIPTLPDGSPGPESRETFRKTDGTPGYDEHGRLLRHVNPAKTVTELTYFPEDPTDPRQEHLQRTIIDPAHLAITTEYEVDELGRVLAVHLPRSASVTDDRFVTRTTYNDLDQVVETTTSKPFEFKTCHYYDRTGNRQRIETPLKDETGADIPGGPVVGTFHYDEEFNLVKETAGGSDQSDHFVSRHRYDSAGQRILTLLPEGNQIRYRYDERQLPVAITLGACTDDASTVRTEYDGDGRIKRTIDALGNATTFTFDSFGRVVAVEDALGHITRSNYDKAGNVTAARAFEKRIDGYYLLSRIESEYDELGRAMRAGVNRFDDPLGPRLKSELADAYLASPVPGDLLTTLTFYDAQGRIAKTVDPEGRDSTLTYDALDRVKVQTDPFGNRVEFHYDDHGNLIRQDRIELDGTGLGQRIFSGSSTYDELDRLTTATDSLGNITRFFYDSRGNVVRRVDPLGNVSRALYDIYDRRIADCRELTASGLGGSPVDLAETGYTYDRNSNLIAVTDARGWHTRYLYDALNRRRAIIYPDDSRTTFDYDQNGNLIRTQDNNGLKRHFTLDELGRTIHVAVDDLGLGPAITVEGATFEAYQYDGLSRLIHDENDFARNDVHYNSLGWPIEETSTFTTPLAPLGTPFVIARAYNKTGALTGLTYPNGRQLRLHRDDSLDRLTSVENLALGSGYPGNPSTPDAHDIVTAIEYQGLQRSRCLFGNGAATAFAYDGAGKLIQIEHSSPTTSLLTMQYLFDAAGNMRFRNDIKASGNLGEAFKYDSFYRLVHEASEDKDTFDAAPFAPAAILPPAPIPNRQVDINDYIGSLALPSGIKTFDYDLVGNRLSEELPEGGTLSYDVNELDQYDQRNGINFRYDLNGNLKSDGVYDYVYDSLNRLVKVMGPAGEVRFFHDALGRRILELRNSEATHLICDGPNVIAEYREGELFAQYVPDDGIDRPLQMAVEGNEYWYHTDLVGSVRLMTDRGGNETVSYRYNPFGIMLEVTLEGPYNPLRYTARRLDENLGTYDFRARQYDPQLGRFLQRDPAGMVDGTNLYTYVKNNPLIFLDSQGSHREEIFTPAVTPDLERWYHNARERNGLVPSDRRPSWDDLLYMLYSDRSSIAPPDKYDPFDIDFQRPPSVHPAPDDPITIALYNGIRGTAQVAWWSVAGVMEMANKPFDLAEEYVCPFEGCSYLIPVGSWLRGSRWLSRIPRTSNGFLNRQAWRLRPSVPEVYIRYTSAMAQNQNDALFLRFGVEWAQTRGPLLRGARITEDSRMRQLARDSMDSIGFNRTGLHAMHPLDSIANPFIRSGDIGSTYYFGNQGVNSSFGSQIGRQLNLLGVETGQPFRIRFSNNFPRLGVQPLIAPPASPPDLGR